MSYHIDYIPVRADSRKNCGSPMVRLLMILTVFALFLFCVRSYRPDAWKRLQAVIWPGDRIVIRNAVSVLWRDLRAGQSAAESLAVFCREIFYSAGIR